MAFVEVQIVPVGTNEASFSSYVAQACRVAEKQGVKYQVTPTATVLEGELSQVMPVAQQMHQAAFEAGASRVVTTLSIDERRDKPTSMHMAVASVESQIQ